jgi:hypothetical protein
MDSDLARARAERLFKQEEQQRDGQAATAQHKASAVAVRENMARLRALRLANQDRADNVIPDRAAAPRRRR